MKRYDEQTKTRVKQAYATGRTLQSIADEFGVSKATILNWGKQSESEPRKRGRRTLPAPGERDRLILELAQTLPVGLIARRHGLSRQRVHAILKRWGCKPSSIVQPDRAQSVDQGGDCSRQRKENKEIVISFRLSRRHAQLLRQGVDHSASSPLSTSKLARHIVIGAIEWSSLK